MSFPKRGSAGSRMGAGASGRQVALVSLLIACAVFAVDQITKVWAETSLAHNVPRPWLGELLQLRLIYNSGAAFGMGSGMTTVITCIQIVIAALIILGLFRWVRNGLWTLSLALLLGGALGNIYDRLMRPPGPLRGHVVDFLELPHWPIFNVADIAVTTGAVLLVVITLFNIPAAQSPRATPSEHASSPNREPA